MVKTTPRSAGDMVLTEGEITVDSKTWSDRQFLCSSVLDIFVGGQHTIKR